jgi:hypothetical protein
MFEQISTKQIVDWFEKIWKRLVLQVFKFMYNFSK